MQALKASARYQAGDLKAEAEYNRIRFRPTVREPERLEQVNGRLRAHSTEEGVLKARAIEERLSEDTWRSDRWDLNPALRELDIPTPVFMARTTSFRSRSLSASHRRCHARALPSFQSAAASHISRPPTRSTSTR